MMTVRVRTRSSKKQEIKAVMFGTFILTLLFSSLITAYCCSGPLVLGTELNANGLIEYMCLGNGCEDLTSLRWNDK